MKQNQEPSAVEDAQQAIIQERLRREYNVTVSSASRITTLVGISIPPSLEAYATITQCLEHERPCTWFDIAFHMYDGTWHCYLGEGDLLRHPEPLPEGIGIIVDFETQIHRLLNNLTSENRKMALAKIANMSQEDGMYE